MKRLSSRFLTLALVLSVCAILVNILAYDKYNDAQAGLQAVKKIPVNIGEWEGTDVPVEDLIFEILQTKSIIHRSYKAEKGNVFLSLVYYPQTKVDFHAPEGCLAGQGVNISKKEKDIYIDAGGRNLKIGINQLVRQTNGSEELIYYFYKAGDFVGPSYIKLRLMLALNKFSNKEKSGSLIRVSTPIQSGQANKYATKRLKEFIGLLYPYLERWL